MSKDENSVKMYGVDIHKDHNDVTVTHLQWCDTEQGEVLLNNGHYYNVIAGENITAINFQNGPVKENGVNGATSESLLSILIHRAKILDSNFPSDENKCAITYMENALALFEQRTKDRLSRGVEGQNKI